MPKNCASRALTQELWKIKKNLVCEKLCVKTSYAFANVDQSPRNTDAHITLVTSGLTDGCVILPESKFVESSFNCERSIVVSSLGCFIYFLVLCLVLFQIQ